ncbi:MAG: hypothetical protein LBT45_00370 [Rickettsiales bacterium]|nr:hypothetical protein [Rickettsiales bacterium]
MKKNDYRMVKLAKGEVNVYDFGRTRLHAYRTNNPMGHFVLILEKARRGVVVEMPCFYDNQIELEKYISSLGITVEGILSSYHIAGGNFLGGVKRYSTLNAEAYRCGNGLGVVKGFVKIFGPSVFDGAIVDITDYVARDLVFIAGIRFDINRTEEAFDITIPELNAKYIHMLGHDEHSLMTSVKALEKEEKKLIGILKEGYSLILSSHHAPEDVADLKNKIRYLRRIKELARTCESAQEFMSAVRDEYPDYGRTNFLGMTAESLFADNPDEYRRARNASPIRRSVLSAASYAFS